MPRRSICRATPLAAFGIALCAAAAARALPVPHTVFERLAPVDVAVGAAPGRQALLVRDFTGDRRADLVAIAPARNAVEIFHNRDDGRLTYTDAVFTFGAPTALALADVTAPADPQHGRLPDGIPDLLIGDADGGVTVQTGRSDGVFPRSAQVIDVGAAIRGIAVGELDGQPGLDAAVIDASAIFLLCNDAGRLVPCGKGMPLLPGVGDLIEIAAGDFDADGKTDLVVLSSAEQRLVPLFGRGDATFSFGATVFVSGEASGATSVDLAVARVDGDAIDDVVVVNRSDIYELLGVTVYGGADRRLRGDEFVFELGTVALALADFDVPRGVVDAIGGSADGALTISVNAGDGFDDSALFRVQLRGAQLTSMSALVVGDLNGDSWPDVLSLNDSGDALTPLLNRVTPPCPGDCGGDDVVTIDELTRAVGILLGTLPPGECASIDRDGSGAATVDELIAAVAAALQGCAVLRPPQSATPVAPRLAQ